jgi:hypothetical protein
VDTTPEHDPSKQWNGVIVDTNTIDLTKWRHVEPAKKPWGSFRYTVVGPCPNCGAQVSDWLDSSAPLPALQGKDIVRRKRQVRMIGVACDCLSDHGHAGTTGCGRRWAIPFDDVEKLTEP